MGAEEEIEIGTEKRNVKDTIMQSLFSFGKFNPQSKRIKVHCKAYKRVYEGHAYLRKEHIYLALDLKDGEEKRTDERTSYIGTIGKADIATIKTIRLLRLGLFNGEPIAARSMLIAADDNLSFETTEILQRFIPIADMGAHKADIGVYFQDNSNLALHTTPLKPKDYEARVASLAKKIDRTWDGLLTGFLGNYLDTIKTGAIHTRIEFDLYGKGMYADLFRKVIESLNNSKIEGKMAQDCALYATSFPCKNYLWSYRNTNYLEVYGTEFLEKGGAIVRFFFVNDLDKNSLTDDQMKVVCRHFELYGNRPNSKSGVFLLNQLEVSNYHRKLILTEINHGLISWELGAEHKYGDLTAIPRDIKLSCSQEMAQVFKEKFMFFEQQANTNGSKIARRVTEADYTFWKEKITHSKEK